MPTLFHCIYMYLHHIQMEQLKAVRKRKIIDIRRKKDTVFQFTRIQEILSHITCQQINFD